MSEETFVLDASALLCLIFDEPGADVVANCLAQSVVSAVNYSEVVAKLQERGVSDDEIADGLGELKINILAFDADLAVETGKLRVATRPFGLSLGDRACLALSKTLNAVAVTTDKTWLSLDIGVEIRAVR